MRQFLTVDEALADEALAIMSQGEEITVRGLTTKELLMESFQVVQPWYRIVYNPARKGNIFAMVAETLWMLAGRDDLDWLQTYIPQCKQWSDDGKTWRAAYGPRLRRWYGINPASHRLYPDLPFDADTGHWTDQIDKVRKKLLADPYTRQAIITLWDPSLDWTVHSKDYPCNNWLHFIIRDGKLHLNVAVRSNDLIYGFSHIDFFGWSVLLQLMAHWVGVEIGTIGWNVTSLHIYKRHYRKAKEITDAYWGGPGWHNHVGLAPVPPKVVTDWDDFDSWMKISLNSVETLQRDTYASYTPEGLLPTMKRMLVIYNYWLNFIQKTNNSNDLKKLHDMVLNLPECDFKVAAYQYFQRRYPETFIKLK